MVGSSRSILDPSISQVRHVKVQVLTTDHLISKRLGGIYSDHLEYYLPQYKGDESNPITFRHYLANMTAKTGNYARDKLFYATSLENNPITLHFMYFPHHMVEATKVINRLPYIIAEELLVNPNNFITISVIYRATMVIWDKDKQIFADPNQFHNKDWKTYVWGYKSRGTGKFQDYQADLKNQMGTFDAADIQKFYARAQGKDYEKGTFAST